MPLPASRKLPPISSCAAGGWRNPRSFLPLRGPQSRRSHPPLIMPSVLLIFRRGAVPPLCTAAKTGDGLASAVNSARTGSASVFLSCSGVRLSGNKAGGAAGLGASSGKPVSESDAAVEASFGENILDGDGRESFRSVRETTPCSLMRNSESLEAPGSTTRPTNPPATNRRMRSEMRRSVPTADEMEEFFAAAERQQLRRFSEKYNYDPVNDLPLPGRYEWIQLTP